MYAGIMKWVFIPAWLLVLLWPWPSGSNGRAAFAVCVAAMWAVQGTRAAVAGHATVDPCKVRCEN